MPHSPFSPVPLHLLHPNQRIIQGWSTALPTMERMLLVVFFAFVLLSTVIARETVWDAARIAHQLVENSPDAVGTMATIYPPNHPTSPNEPFSLQEYYASCYRNGSLTLLFLPISRHSQNILQSPHRAASISIASQNPTARKPRVSLIGGVTIFSGSRAPDEAFIKSCYLAQHPDARWWLPEDDDAPHISYWARFDPQTIYFVGGFGDTHYIGYIPLETYKNASSAMQANATVGVDARLGIDGVLVEQE